MASASGASPPSLLVRFKWDRYYVIYFSDTRTTMDVRTDMFSVPNETSRGKSTEVRIIYAGTARPRMVDAEVDWLRWPQNQEMLSSR